MAIRWWMLIVLACLSFTPIACSTAEDTDQAESEEGEESPEQLAKENNAEAEEALKLSDKGVDDDGEKVFKHEAKDYFDFKKNPTHRTFEMPVEWARTFIDAAYAAGAEKIWVVLISEDEFGGEKIRISDSIVVVLPTDAAKRKAVIDLYNKELEEVDEPKFPDVGQKYIYIVAD